MPQIFTCTACEQFETQMQEMIVAHQAVCVDMEPEKRETRKAALTLYFPEDVIPQVLELAESATAKQRKT